MGWLFTHWRAELQNSSTNAEVNMTWEETFLVEILTYDCYPDKPHQVRAISWSENSWRQKECSGEVSNLCHALAFPCWQFSAAGLSVGWFVCLPRVEHKCNPQLPLIMLQSSLQLIEFQGFAQRSLEPHFGKTSGGLLLIQQTSLSSSACLWQDREVKREDLMLSYFKLLWLGWYPRKQASLSHCSSDMKNILLSRQGWFIELFCSNTKDFYF